MSESSRLCLVPVTLREARAFVALHHRHHKPPHFGLFAIGAADGEGQLVGVVIVGRPVARHNSDGYTAEVARLATLGHSNCCSMLYGAAWRAARAMGYRRLITYTLETEPGTSLRAAGWKEIGRTEGGSWSRPSRERIDDHPLQAKIKWEVA